MTRSWDNPGEPETMSGKLEAAFLHGLLGNYSQTKILARIEIEAMEQVNREAEPEVVNATARMAALGFPDYDYLP